MTRYKNSPSYRPTRWLFALVTSVLLSGQAATADESHVLKAIPELETQGDKTSFTIENDRLSITALKGTDLFTDATGESSADNLPRALFAPKGDFILSAKITANVAGAYDGGGLVVYGGKQNWAKFLFEKFKSGKLGVSTTVSDGKGDDAYHNTYNTNTVYLKIARKGELYVFYTSTNGTDWSYTRSFGMKEGPIKVGFIAQSPLSEKVTVSFSDVKFRPTAFKDFWQGEP
jgi:uncharacterized protein